MIPNFERNRSSWNIRVAIHEVIRVNMMLDAIARETTTDAVVWLVKLSPMRRSWIVRDRSVTAWITADANYDEPHFALPIPDSFFRHVLDIARDENGLDLYCNEVDGTIVARCGERFIAVDEPVGPTFEVRDLPYREDESRHHTSPAVAKVSVSDLQTFSSLVHSIPRGVDVDEVAPPFVSIAIGDGKFAFTADWRRHGLGRITGAVPADTTGAITTQFYPYTVARLLRCQDPSDEATLYVDGVDAEHLYFVGEGWGIRVLQDDEVTGHWYVTVAQHLSSHGCTVQSHSTESLPRVMKFSYQGIDCVGRFFVREGRIDFFQVTAALQSRVETSLETFTRINAINEELVGAQVVLREGMLVVVAECPLESNRLPVQCVWAVTQGVEKCASLDEMLPLFSVS